MSRRWLEIGWSVFGYGVCHLGKIPVHNLASIVSAAFCVGSRRGIRGWDSLRGMKGVQSFMEEMFS